MVDALKKLKIPNLSWPGGCFADTYHWKDGIGPKQNRPTIVNRWWGGVTEDNSFGTHDFLNMCELIGTDPYLSGNVGSGTVQEFIDWVQYTTFDGISSDVGPAKEQTAEINPWNVKFWGIGNEAWGCGGNMRPEYYVDVYPSSIPRFYCMAKWSKFSGLHREQIGSDYNWTEVLMQEFRTDLIEGVALHHYSFVDWNKKGPATDFTEEQYFTHDATGAVDGIAGSTTIRI